jgi:protein-disulfide isomerase
VISTRRSSRCSRAEAGVQRPWPACPLALVAALLAGCAGDEMTVGGGQNSAKAAATAGTSTGTPEKPRFNPFPEIGATAVGRREVIENPTLVDVMKPGPLPEMALGRPDAPVTIIKYASLTCPYCRQFQLSTFPKLKREYIDTGKVRFIVREFPIGFQSGAATIALRCAAPEAYFPLYEKFLARQSAWVSQEVRREPIFKVAAEVGMSRAQFDACYQNHGMIEALKWVKERGRNLGVIGTPNFFINGTLVKSVLDIKDIREKVDPIVEGRVAAGNGAATR